MSSDNPYERMIPPTPFEKAVDAEIAAANQRFLNDPEAQARAEQDGIRWRHIRHAEEAAGPHGVVLPVRLAQDILALLQGKPALLEDVLGPGSTALSLADHIEKATQRPEVHHEPPAAVIRRQERQRIVKILSGPFDGTEGLSSETLAWAIGQIEKED